MSPGTATTSAPHLILFPALAVMLAVLACNFLGDTLRDYLDPCLIRRTYLTGSEKPLTADELKEYYWRKLT